MPRRVLLLVLLAFGAFAASSAAAQAATYPAGFQEETLISGLTQPMAVEWTPDGRRIVIEKSGVVKVAAPGATTATPIDGLDLSARVNSNHDRGLLGLAVDHDYAINNYIYLLYTYDLTPGPGLADSGGAAVSQLLRVKLSLTNQVLEEKVILGTYTSGPCPAPANNVDCIPSDYDSHSIGTVRTFRDGTLFVGSGDGASYNEADPRALRALNEQSLAGKILNVDREGKGRSVHPFCPENTNVDDVCTKVWVRGLRNPFRFEVRYDRALNIGDVGWGTREELNVATMPGGQSFGWPCYEGTGRTGGYQVMPECQAEYAKPAGTHKDPSLSWCGCGGGGSAIGGPTYFPGTSYPAGFRDTTFYGDYVRHFIKRAVPDGNGGFTEVPFATDWLGVQLTQERGTGDLVYVTPGNFGAGQGSVRAVRYTAGNRPPVAKIVADKTSGLAPLTVNFDATTSTDADNDPLTYVWDFGDGTTSTAAKPVKTYTVPGTYKVRLSVSDDRGVPVWTETTITVGNSAPVATITSPANESTYRDGQPVTLTGTGVDPQDGSLTGSALTWQVLLHHGGHTHPLTEMTGGSVTFTPLTDHDADSHYEIRLTAKDSTGLTNDTSIRIMPETVNAIVRSEPYGAAISWAGVSSSTGRNGIAAIGFRAGVEAASTFTRNGVTYAFDRWSDGGAQAHTYTVPATNFELVAHYRVVSVQPPAGPVLALGFDETSGTTSADKSGKGNNATLAGAAKLSTGGRYAGALDLNGTSGSWATVADSATLDLTNAMTLEAWVKPRTRSGWRTIIMKEFGADWQSYALYGAADPYAGSGTGGEPVGFVNSSGTRGPAPLPLNAWSHLALTFDGVTQKLYVDGNLVASRASTTQAQVGTGALRIGGNAMWGEHFDGLIDDVRIYDRAISAAEVATDRTTPVGGTTPQPVPGPQPIAAYGFEETSGATTADSSSFNGSGTISGATRIAAGKKGRALDFDGTNDRVIVADAPQLRMTGDMTLSAWVKPDKVSQWRTVLLKENTASAFQDYALYAAADPYQEVGQYNEPAGFISGLGVRGPKLTTGAWSHLAFVFDGSSEKLYINGTLAGSRVFEGYEPQVPSGAGPLSIGGNGLWGEWFDGAIDEVRLFDSALTATQIAADKDRITATARASAARAKVTLKRAGAGTAKSKASRAAKAKAKKGRKAARRMTVLRGKDAAVTIKRGDRRARDR